MGKCIVCEKTTLEKVITLGFHPLADTFLKKEQLLSPQKMYPLNCLLCKNCGHLRNEIFVSREERYVESNYSYTSSNSPSAMAHWDEFCETVSNFIKLKPNDTVIEFGSNDGYLLKQFQKKGAKVTGIDPSPVVAKIANKNGLYTICDFLGSKAIDSATKKNGKAKVICGNNVLNHIEKINEAILAIKSGLKSNGFLVIEVPSLRDTIQKYLFDMIFHEHVSTFSIKSIDCLFKKHGLYIANVENIPYHGGSHRIYASPDPKKYNKDVNKYIKREEKDKLFNAVTYKKFMRKIIKDKNNVLAKIYSLKQNGKTIVAVGAGARSNTLLNFYKLDATVIDFITDASKHKIGKFTLGSNIEVKADSALASKNINVALITGWNIGKYLIQKIKKINNKIEFIVPGEKELL